MAERRKPSNPGAQDAGEAPDRGLALEEAKPRVAKPPLFKVVLLNDDYTPREFVVQVLKAVFRTTEDQAYRIMMTAHQRGACVIAVFTRDVAETKAKEATDLGKSQGYPLFFTTEPEE
jgi:ATP-dependent Clp protease adaptor protein ClpS